MVSRIYESIIQENFDIQDTVTRKTLLTIDEADQTKVLDSLTSKLYQSIMDKVDDIDFGSIPESKGDITAIQNYDQMIECIGVIKSILVEYRQDLDPVENIQEAIQNIQDRKDTFMKAFNLNMDFPILLYNTIVLSIVSSISLIIATSIEFIKDAGDQGFDIKFDKVSYVKSKNSILYQNLTKFNKECKNGEIDKCLNHIISTGTKQLMGVDALTVVGFAAVVAILINIVPIMRELVFFFFHAKQSVADYFAIQADLLQINSEYVRNNTLAGTEKERKEIAKKQSKIAQKFRKIANAFEVNVKTSEKKAQKDIKDSKKKYKIDEVVPEKLDSADSSIF